MRQAMGDVLKLLLLFCIVTVVTGALHQAAKKKRCTEGQYKFKDACFQCTPCGDFMYEQEKCSETSNTVCGWCGKKPNLDNLSHEILASYQTKCLMSSLGFIGMTKLKDEMINVFNDDTEKFSGRDTIIDGENLEVIDAGEGGEDHFKMAKDSLNRFDDSEEQELPDPTYEEGKDSDSDEVDESREVKPSVKVVKLDKAEDVDEPMEDYDEIDAEYEAKLDYDEKLEEEIAQHVNAYYVEKHRKTGEYPMDPIHNPWMRGSRIISHKQMQQIIDDLEPGVPIMTYRRNPSSSSEDSNEREIKWDNWVDDEVKTLGKNVEIVEAEEIRPDENEKYDAYEVKPRKRLTEIEKKDIVSHLTEKFKSDYEFNIVSRPQPPFLSPVIFACLGFIIISTIVALGYVQSKTDKKTFHGVPIDAEDYHMIIDASKHLEELEKKEKHANRHVHVNPVFDV